MNALGTPSLPLRVEQFDVQWPRSVHAYWKVAQSVVLSAAERNGTPLRSSQLGRVDFIGGGMYRVAFAITLDGNAPWSGDVVVLIPKLDAPVEAQALWGGEAEILQILQGQTHSFRIPKLLAVLRSDRGQILIEERVRGVPLNIRKEGTQGVSAPECLGEIAREIHGLYSAQFLPIFPAVPNRRAFALELVRRYRDSADHEIRAALEWYDAHLPPEIPCCFTHGDLLGQNILVDLYPPYARTVIDWTSAGFSDPAYDIAIVTRGVRHPFGIGDGLNRLLLSLA